MRMLTQHLQAVRRRMLLNRFLSTTLLVLAIAWGAAALLVLSDRLIYLPLPLAWVPWASTAASLAVAGLAAFLGRPSLLAAAVHADGRLALAERLSSALLVTGDSPMEQAVREDAQRVLPRLATHAACPVAWPRRRAWGAGASLLFLALALAAPEWDLFGRKAGRAEQAQALLLVQTAGTALEQRVQKYQEEAKARGVEKGEIGKGLEQLATELKEGIQDPKAALAEVNDLQARLKAEMDQFREKDKASLARDLQRVLKAQAAEQGKVPSPQADSLKDLMDDVRELSKKAEAGTATPQELAEMQKALSSLAEALGKTEATRQPAEELKRASESLEQNPGAMPQLSDDLKKLSDQLGQMDQALDKEQMMEMAKADLEELKRQLGGQAQDPWQGEVTAEGQQEFDQKTTEGICPGCGAPQGGGQPGQPQPGQGQGEGQGQEGEGQGVCPVCGGPAGQGMGSGIGQGARPEGELGDHAFERTKLKGELGEGEFIGSFFVKGVPPKGPTQVKYVEMLEQYEHEQARALEKEPIPTEQRESIRRYFDALKPPAEPETTKP